MYKSKGTPPSTKKGRKTHKKTPGLHYGANDDANTIRGKVAARFGYSGIRTGTFPHEAFAETRAVEKHMKGLKKSLITRKK